MNGEDNKSRAMVTDHHHHPPPPQPTPQSDTLQGVANYPPPPQHRQPVNGFSQPVPLPGATEPAYTHALQTVPSYAVSEEYDRSRGIVTDHHQYSAPPPVPQYGTLQEAVNYPPPPPPQHQQPAIGFSQPVPLPATPQTAYPPSFQTAPCYATAAVDIPEKEPLPCCGIGYGWGLFISGLFLGAIPWYIGLFFLMC